MAERAKVARLEEALVLLAGAFPTRLTGGKSGEKIEAEVARIRAESFLAYPRHATPEVKEVLSWMCFQCIGICQAFRAAGHEIKTRAEDEQAFVLHWLLTLALEHGPGWRKAAADQIRKMQGSAAA